MGEVELQSENNLLIIHAVIYFYGMPQMKL